MSAVQDKRLDGGRPFTRTLDSVVPDSCPNKTSRLHVA